MSKRAKDDWSPQLELMTRLSVAHAMECADFLALPRVKIKRGKYGEVTTCRHCSASLWTADELRKALK